MPDTPALMQQAEADSTKVADLTKTSPAEGFTKLAEIAKDADANLKTQQEKDIYFNLLTQNLKTANVLPELAINYMNDAAPKDAAGTVTPKALSDQFKATNTGRGKDVLTNAIVGEAQTKFPKFMAADPNDGVTAGVSKSDIKKVLDGQPKRKP